MVAAAVFVFTSIPGLLPEPQSGSFFLSEKLPPEYHVPGTQRSNSAYPHNGNGELSSMAERTIREILKEQAQLLTRLEEALDQEFSLLKERKALELPELSKVKTDILLKIQTNDSSIKNHPEKDLLKTDLLRAKNLLLERLAEVKRKNEVNGRLIELNLAASRRLSSSLVQIRDTSTVTYDERGNKNALAGLHLDFEA